MRGIDNFSWSWHTNVFPGSSWSHQCSGTLAVSADGWGKRGLPLESGRGCSAVLSGLGSVVRKAN